MELESRTCLISAGLSTMYHRSFFTFLSTLTLAFAIVAGQKSGGLVKLDEDTWSQLLQGEWMVEFYAPWCPACKQLKTHWDRFSTWSDDLGIKVASVDVTANPGLSGRFMVTALPTIYHVKDAVFRQYKGSRDTNAFVSFVEEKKWEQLEPVSKWKDPNSVQMSLISYFFKISMALRAIHTRLVEEYGLPFWASYVLFALATILLGALLGLIIVCIIDLLFPAKPIPHGSESKASSSSVQKQSASQVKEDEKKDEEEKGDEKKDK